MKKLNLVWLILPLCACAHEYDAGELPVARAAEQVGLENCNSRERRGDISTATDLVNCYLPIERQATASAKIKHMELFDAYQARLLLLASDVDAGRIPRDQFGPRYTLLNQEFGASVNQVEAQDRAQNAQTMRAIGEAGAAMQGAAAAYQAATPPPPVIIQPLPQQAPPRNCRTVFVGNVANTQCY